ILALLFTDPPPTATPPLSLHDALPISRSARRRPLPDHGRRPAAHAARVGHRPGRDRAGLPVGRPAAADPGTPDVDAAVLGGYRRSEEHTSELQSLTNLVCRLLLEKKKH